MAKKAVKKVCVDLPAVAINVGSGEEPYHWMDHQRDKGLRIYSLGEMGDNLILVASKTRPTRSQLNCLFRKGHPLENANPVKRRVPRELDYFGQVVKRSRLSPVGQAYVSKHPRSLRRNDPYGE
jgi:hypothetical protein